MDKAQIRESLEHIVSQQPVLSEAMNDGHVDEVELKQINEALISIKKEIEKITQSPEELQQFLEELKNITLQKGIDEKLVLQAFQKEYTAYQANMVDLHNTSPEDATSLQSSSNQEYLNKKQEETDIITHTKSELGEMKKATLESTIDSYLKELTATKGDLRNATRRSGPDARKAKRYILNWLSHAKSSLRRLRRVSRREERTGRSIIQQDHAQALQNKLTVILANSKDYISQAATSDLDEAYNFFPPNVFPDANFYIPDWKPSTKTLKRHIGTVEYTGSPLPGGLTLEQQNFYRACQEETLPKNSLFKKGNELLDTDVRARLEKNGTNRKGADLIVGFGKLALLGANIFVAYKAVRGLFGTFFGKDKKERTKSFMKFLGYTGAFAAFNVIDFDKAKQSIFGIQSSLSGEKILYNKNTIINNSAALLALKNPHTSEEEKITVHGSLITATALSAINFQEAATNEIFVLSGNKVKDIDTDKLIEFYKVKFKSDTKKQNECVAYAKDLALMQKTHPELTRLVMQQHAITTTDFTNNPNTLVSSRLVDDLHKASLVLEGLTRSNKIDNALKSQTKTIVEEIGTNEYDNLVEGIEALPVEIVDDVINKSIEFKAIDHRLYMKTKEGYPVALDLTQKKIALPNNQGVFVEFPISTSTTEELLRLSIILSKRIPSLTEVFSVEHPWKFRKGVLNLKKIYAETGDALLIHPSSWIQGQTVDIIDGGSVLGDSLNKFKNDSVLESFSQYLNSLNIWKGITINTQTPTNPSNGSSGQNRSLTPPSSTSGLWTSIKKGATKYVERVRDTGDQTGRKIKSGAKDYVERVRDTGDQITR